MLALAIHRFLGRRFARSVVSVALAWLLPVSVCLVGSAVPGCGADQDSSAVAGSTGGDRAGGSGDTAGRPPRAGGARSARPRGKKWSGWRWKGQGDECFFKVEQRCFPTFEKACAAARCGKRPCTRNQSAPVKVSCAGSPHAP